MVELCGEGLKLKYKTRKGAKKTKSSYGGNSGTPHRGNLPLGLRRHVRPGRKRY